MFSIKEIKFDDRSEIQRFLSNAGTSLKSFRYFKTRSLDVQKNHLITLLAYYGEEPIGYAHLDSENGYTWLGIAVSDGYQKNGLGNRLLSELLDWAKILEVKEIWLTVDNDNLPAHSLYKKFGFEYVKSDHLISYYTLIINDTI